MGKVHGSLARAGKVKSATPKVEKQEKKKEPKGRALKRLKYTRRFVNVTMTGGKRKIGVVLRTTPFSASPQILQEVKNQQTLTGAFATDEPQPHFLSRPRHFRRRKLGDEKGGSDDDHRT
ncbi:hypothetical protein CDV55_102163 [Aspergillus turcosus]|nr:hypothetical protein CDV55_102163 [Aspergillus turcosus]